MPRGKNHSRMWLPLGRGHPSKVSAAAGFTWDLRSGVRKAFRAVQVFTLPQHKHIQSLRGGHVYMGVELGEDSRRKSEWQWCIFFYIRKSCKWFYFLNTNIHQDLAIANTGQYFIPLHCTTNIKNIYITFCHKFTISTLKLPLHTVQILIGLNYYKEEC